MKNQASLIDVSEWHKQIELPQVQRNFVWKSYQIENLWDSLLRGYPVGSFIFAKINSTSSPSLLDGQQRATSITLAFQSTSSEEKIFNANHIHIYIDLKKPNPNDNRKYIFRVITKSHPWGYRKEDNTKPLDRNNIQNALEKYNIEKEEKFYNCELSKFWPYDASLIIPYSIFLNAAKEKKSFEEVVEKIKHFHNIPKTTKELNSEEEFTNQLQKCIDGTSDNKLFYSVKEIYEATVEICSKQIPISYLDLDKSSSTIVTIDQTQVPEVQKVVSDDKEEEIESDEIENLFVRLNSAGTPIKGEELNYSMLKAVIDRKAQKLIEDSCQGLLSPASFITIAYRLFQHSQTPEKLDKNASIVLRIKPKDFQRMIKQESLVNQFTDFLINTLLNAENNILDQTRKILTYSPQNMIGLPPYLVIKTCSMAPEITFMLMYRIVIRNDKIETGSPLCKKVLGMFTYFAWFGKGLKLKNHETLMKKISKLMTSLPPDQFWSSLTVNHALKMYNNQPVLLEMYRERKIKNEINALVRENSNRITNGTLKQLDQDLKDFSGKVFFEKNLITYAQRKYFNDRFSEVEFSLEDTNVPFDWDHISPQALIKNNPNAQDCIKDWYSSNGNFRALSFSENRSKNDNSPSASLKTDSDLSYSFCKKEWKHHDLSPQDLKKSENTQLIYKLIMERNLAIYLEWYNTLSIEELTLESNNEVLLRPLTNLLDEKKWVYLSDELIFNLSSMIHDFIFFIEFTDDEDGVLGENSVEFGIHSAIKDNLLLATKNKSTLVFQAENGGFCISKNYTLQGNKESDFVNLIESLCSLIHSLDQQYTKPLIEILKNSLNAEYVEKINWEVSKRENNKKAA